MNILFVNCVDFLEATLPEGIAILSSILKGRGHKVEVFDASFMKPKQYCFDKTEKADEGLPAGIQFHKPTPYTLADLVARDPEVDIFDKFSETVNKFNPSLIAVSAMTTNYEKSLELIKKVRPKCKVVFGGVHPTLMPEAVLRQKEVDFVCIGEGEVALSELCESLETGKDFYQRKSLYRNSKETKRPPVIKNGLSSFMDLDLVPPPDLSIFDPRHFFRPFLGNIYKGIFMSTSRGCPRACCYCVNNRLRDLFKDCGASYIRFQSPKVIARNVEFLKRKYGISWFKFSDDTFLLRPVKNMHELRDLLRPLNIMFGCSVDPATVNEEKVKIAKEMGCVSMSIGIETGNEILRRKVLGRNISDEQIRKAIRIVKDHDIKISTFNMIGLPGETKENVFETIRLNKELEIPDANVYILYPFPGTKIYEDFKISLDRYRRIPPMTEAYRFSLSKMSKDELLFFLKTFNLYLVLPKSYWMKIEEIKKAPALYKELVKISQDIVNAKYLAKTKGPCAQDGLDGQMKKVSLRGLKYKYEF
jgi:anaerobic magnesium-protoporphyrin IX monomethyl ester cyclase